MYKPLLAGVCLLGMWSCQPTTPPGQATQCLQGEWHVINAKRNDVGTTSLNGAYFRFESPTQLSTNLFGDSSRYDIRIASDAEHIKQTATAELPAIDYVVQQCDTNLLRLSFEYRNFTFITNLTR